MKEKTKIKKTDALIIVDFQNDFCPGGALPVSRGDEIRVPLIRLIPLFNRKVITQDWHPGNHCSFKKNGGDWPIHCVAGTPGARNHYLLELMDPRDFIWIKKGTNPDKEAYSGFDGIDHTDKSLADVLRQRGIKRIFVCGLATDYCVKATVLDGLEKEKGFEVYVILDAIRAVNKNPDDGKKALEEMKKTGAKLISSSSLEK